MKWILQSGETFIPLPVPVTGLYLVDRFGGHKMCFTTVAVRIQADKLLFARRLVAFKSDGIKESRPISLALHLARVVRRMRVT